MEKIIVYHIEKKILVEIKPEDVLDQLYYLEVEIPTEKHVNEYIKKNKKDNISKFFVKNITQSISKIKQTISQIGFKIPLYDVSTENLFIVHQSLIYNKVIVHHYRFPDNELMQKLDETKNEIEKTVKMLEQSEKNLNFNEISIIRKYKKINLMLHFMQSFDIDVLYNTYIRTLYLNAEQLGQDLTICNRPSYMPQLTHIAPYYTKNEIINMALNMGLIKSKNEKYDEEIISQLCKKVSENDINGSILLEHQSYIMQKDTIGLVQYYSMQGSYLMNQYLRNQVSYEYKNEYLEHLISTMWKLINNAPMFDKSYILYRFVQTDDFINDLNIGDTFIEKGFMSTTRNPFYKSDAYKFGSILMKIVIPAKVIGVALCIETVSHFPQEQEIILAPSSKFKLIHRDDQCVYYHTDKQFGKQISVKYEFEYIEDSKSKGNVSFIDRPLYQETEPVNFLTIDKTNVLTINERIKIFLTTHVNPMYQFNTTIGNKKIVIKAEWCDSTVVYKNFYALNTKHGFNLYSIYNNHLLFVIEIGEKESIPCMFVNYYIKYSTLNKDDLIGVENFLTFIASVAYYFEISKVIIYNDYMSCNYSSHDVDKDQYTYKTYCLDYYQYLKRGKKKYVSDKISNTDIFPKFKYFQLDVLNNIKASSIIIKNKMDQEEKDEIYQIYTKLYQPIMEPFDDSLSKFYLWIVENHCSHLDLLIKKIYELKEFKYENPFIYDYYIFDAVSYLYNKKLISMYPQFVNQQQFDEDIIKLKNASKNRYRLMETAQRI